ncbi:MAG TPA: hypothetical protein VKU92_09465 [Acidimicrobiales bacterium]|nr:hypothetical protein [Acidimicrobiales bacterium]
MSRLRVALALGAVPLLATACGIPIATSPTRLQRSEIPPALFVSNQEQQSGCPKPIAANPAYRHVIIYLVQSITGGLVSQTECVKTQSVTVQQVLTTLEAAGAESDYPDDTALNVSSDLQSVGPGPSGIGPCPPKRHRQTVSSTSTTTTTAPSGTGCTMATVRLDRYFLELQGEAPIQEIGQIVWSLAKSLGVREVRFLGPGGGKVAVETASGRFVDTPVTTSQYTHIGI